MTRITVIGGRDKEARYSLRRRQVSTVSLGSWAAALVLGVEELSAPDRSAASDPTAPADAERGWYLVSPRPYRLGQRQAATDRTRARIVAAAHDLLSAEEGLAGFSVDAVARLAGVARMTVYYQFGSKLGLIQALFDELAASGRLAERLPAAFSRPEPLEALREVIAAFGRFWASDRLVIRRARALAAVDPELEQGLQERDGWRRNGVRVVLGRLAEAYGRPAPDAFDETVDIAYTLSSFETFDTLAGATRDVEEVTPIVQQLVLAALGWSDR